MTLRPLVAALLVLVVGACAAPAVPMRSAPPGPPSSPAYPPPAPSSNAAPSVEESAAGWLSHDDAVQDARELVALLESSHPDCYAPFGGRIAFHRDAGVLFEGIPADGLKTEELAGRLQTFLSKLGDGHTFVEAGRVSFDERSPRLPLRFGITTDGLFVAASDYAELADARGQLLLAFGGIPMGDLADRLKRVTAVENEFQALGKLRRWLTYVSGCSRLTGKDCGTGKIDLVLRTRSGKVETRTVALRAQTNDKPESWRLAPPLHELGDTVHLVAKMTDPFFFTVFSSPRAAYFRIGTIMGREAYEFARRYGWGDPKEMLSRYYERKRQPMPTDVDKALEGVPSFYEQAHRLLDEMKKDAVPTLVIDLRGNGGGMTPSVLPFLYELFGDEYFSRELKGSFVTRYSPLYLEKMHKTLDEVRRDQGNASLELGGYGFPKRAAAPPGERRKKEIAELVEKGFSFAPRLDALNGQPLYRPERILVLSDPDTYSAAFHLLAYLKEMGAEIVGVPSGQAPNAFMETTPFTLGRSRLKGSISNSAQLFMPETPSATVFPVDHPLSWKIAAKFNFDDDASLRLALSLAGERARPKN